MSERDWQSIDTASMDDVILIRSRAGYIATAEWRTFGWALVDSFVGSSEGYGGPYYLVDDWKPVEWQPFPADTDAAAEKAEGTP